MEEMLKYVLATALLVLIAVTVFTRDADSRGSKGTTEAVSYVIKERPKPRPLRLRQVSAEMQSLRSVDRADLPTQIRKYKSALAFWDGRGRWLRATRQEKCWDVPWQRSCTIARHHHKLNSALLAAATRRLWKEFPLTNDWQTAVRIAQRVYPGTSSWMLSISDREGGWSTWVWYGGRPWTGYHIGNDFLGADTVGGWMQFRFSTFAPYWRGAIKDLRRRGFAIPVFPDRGGPAEYQPWLDPLGQALTAGYMRYYGKDGCHWCL